MTHATGLIPPLTEAQWQDKVVDTGRTFGWKVAHFRPARTIHGWRTPGSYDAQGWPDLILVHPDRQLVLFRELKADRGRLVADQETWGHILGKAGADWDVWRPKDWPLVVHTLTGGRAQ